MYTLCGGAGRVSNYYHTAVTNFLCNLCKIDRSKKFKCFCCKNSLSSTIIFAGFTDLQSLEEKTFCQKITEFKEILPIFSIVFLFSSNRKTKSQSHWNKSTLYAKTGNWMDSWKSQNKKLLVF